MADRPSLVAEQVAMEALGWAVSGAAKSSIGRQPKFGMSWGRITTAAEVQHAREIWSERLPLACESGRLHVGPSGQALDRRSKTEGDRCLREVVVLWVGLLTALATCGALVLVLAMTRSLDHSEHPVVGDGSLLGRDDIRQDMGALHR
jgi:hypothetical protein